MNQASQVGQAGWDVRALEGGVSQTFRALEAGMQVVSIASLDLQTCQVSDKVAEVLTRPALERFDYIPASDRGQIVGVLHRVEAGKRPGGPEISGTISVGEAMQPLDQLVPISANASLLSYIENADRSFYQLVARGKDIIGIVTPSDLQKFPVRPLLFSAIAGVELLLAEWLRQNYREQDWLAVLSEKRRAIIAQRWLDWGSDNTALDLVSVTEFCDKRDAALHLGAFDSKSAARKKLRDIEWLRHAVMHSADYALTPENAQRVSRTMRQARETIAILQDALE
ncbi:MAG: hypothetical protein EBE86_011935 [Hormoscilla sp. GUM202]|nr:hypothetical protein [Hormoscilla sp. GUM202]